MSNYSYLDLDIDLSSTYLKDLSIIENEIAKIDICSDNGEKFEDKDEDEKRDDVLKHIQPTNAVQSFDIAYGI